MKRLLRWILIVLVLGGVGWRLKRHFVPAGASIQPFLLGSTEERSSKSPSGRTLYWRFNDAGAAHSGFHFTWCYVDHWLTGKRVVVSGYSTPSVRRGEEEFPLYWENGESDQFSVRFTMSRSDPAFSWFSGELP